MNIETLTLVRQSYGIAMSQVTFGGPRGIWLECSTCDDSQQVKGSRWDDDIFALPDSEIAKVYRRHGWTGEGDRMLKAKCPKCSAGEPS